MEGQVAAADLRATPASAPDLGALGVEGQVGAADLRAAPRVSTNPELYPCAEHKTATASERRSSMPWASCCRLARCSCLTCVSTLC